MDQEKLELADIANLDFTTVIWVAAPIMFTLVLLEYLFGSKKFPNLYSGKDFLASLSIGIGNLILTLVENFFCSLLDYGFLKQKLFNGTH